MWILQYKAFLSHKKLGHVIQSGFNNMLPGTETEALTVRTDDEAIKAKEDNNSAMAILTMPMKKPEMLNMIMLEKKRDAD